jgi:hypothetical protein
MAVYANLSIDQGSSFSSTVSVEDQAGLTFNLTSYTARGQLRKSYSSTTYTPFTVAIPSPATGKIEISLSSTQTAALKPGRYVYDVEIVQGSLVNRVVEGQIEVTPRVTRTV